MDLVINYSSPIIFSAIVTAFFALFIVFRNYRFHLNALYGAFGIIASLWLYFLYSFSQNEDYETLVYLAVLGGLMLYFILLIFHSLEILKAKVQKLIPDKALYFPAWISYLLAGETILIALLFSVFVATSSSLPSIVMVLGLIDFPESLPGIIGSVIFVLVFIFSAKISLLSLITFYHLLQNIPKNRFGFLEDSFIFSMGFFWSALSLGIFFFSARSARVLAEGVRLETPVIPLLVIFTLTNALLLASLINRRYFLGFRVATAQFIASSIIIFNLVSLFNSGSTEEVILRAILIVVLAVLSHLLIRSVIKEVNRGKQIQSKTKEIASSNAKLKELDEAKSEFISIASHQLRTPLTSIKGYASLALENTFGKIPALQRKAVEKLYVNNEKLVLLVEDMLNASRLEAGRLEYEFEETDIPALVAETVENMKLYAKSNNLYLKFVKPREKLPLVLADKRKISEIVANLIDNAVKYTPVPSGTGRNPTPEPLHNAARGAAQNGGVTVSIEKCRLKENIGQGKITGVKNGYGIQIKVSDTGIGMDEKQLGLIFEKFKSGTAQGSKLKARGTLEPKTKSLEPNGGAETASGGGTGLGVYISRQMARAHGGDLRAESAGRGRGSTFILELPIVRKK